MVSRTFIKGLKRPVIRVTESTRNILCWQEGILPRIKKKSTASQNRQKHAWKHCSQSALTSYYSLPGYSITAGSAEASALLVPCVSKGLYLLNVSQGVSESVSPSAKFVPVVATKLLYILLSNFTQPLSVLISKHLLILKAIGLNILQIIQFCYSNYNLCMGIAACAPKHAWVFHASRMAAHAMHECTFRSLVILCALHLTLF